MARTQINLFEKPGRLLESVLQTQEGWPGERKIGTRASTADSDERCLKR